MRRADEHSRVGACATCGDETGKAMLPKADFFNVTSSHLVALALLDVAWFVVDSPHEREPQFEKERDENKNVKLVFFLFFPRSSETWRLSLCVI